MQSDLRMKKTLASLAVAMTSTALVLHWMDPTLQAGRPTLSPQEILSISREAVGGSDGINSARWRDVEVITDEQVQLAGLSLAASRDRRDCHFFVDAAGRPYRESTWSNQEAYRESPGTVRIHFERIDPSTDAPSEAQWQAVRSLISVLDGALSARGKMPVHIRTQSAGSNAVFYSSSL